MLAIIFAFSYMISDSESNATGQAAKIYEVVKKGPSKMAEKGTVLYRVKPGVSPEEEDKLLNRFKMKKMWETKSGNKKGGVVRGTEEMVVINMIGN